MLGELDVEPGAERAVAAALRGRASAVLADDPEAALALLERARAEGLGSLTVLAGADPQALVGELPVVPRSRLLDARVPSVTPEGFGYDPDRRELWFAGETAEAVMLELEARRREVAAEAADARAAGRREAARVADETAEAARAAATAFGGVPAALSLDRELARAHRVRREATDRRDRRGARRRARASTRRFARGSTRAR